MGQDRGSKSAKSKETRTRKVRPLPILVLAAVGAAALWYVTFGTSHQEVRQSGPGGFPMPAFRLPVLNAGLLEGDTTFFSSDDLKGHIVLLAYWATWCKPCIAEQPLLMELQDDYGEAGLRVVGVLDNDQTKHAFEWLQTNHRERFFTVVGDKEVVHDGHVGGLPATLLVDRDGQVIERFDGYRKEREPYIRQRVRELTTRR